eukprot:824061-Prorocentrum_minimum.AAC.1
MHGGGEFMREGGEFMRGGGEFIREGGEFMREGGGFMREGGEFMRRGGEFLQVCFGRACCAVSCPARALGMAECVNKERKKEGRNMIAHWARAAAVCETCCLAHNETVLATLEKDIPQVCDNVTPFPP